MTPAACAGWHSPDLNNLKGTNYECAHDGQPTSRTTGWEPLYIDATTHQIIRPIRGERPIVLGFREVDEGRLVLSFFEFLRNPAAALGLVPVFSGQGVILNVPTVTVTLH